MKIVVTAVIDLDAEVWREAYGTDTAAEIRAMVKSDTEDALQHEFDARGLVAKVEVRR